MRTEMTVEQRALAVVKILDEIYPFNDKCYLHYEKPYELLIATIMSAQCTDDRVNMVTRGLFKKYPTIEAFAYAELSELETDIHSTGFYRSKAKNIIAAMNMLLTEHGGDMPHDIEVLTKFPGVGRKTANVVRGHIFKIPSIVVDTHVKRVSYKIGLTENTDPEKVEFDLMKILPQNDWIKFNTQIIAHGRAVCKARSPECVRCALANICMENSNKDNENY